MNELGDNYKLYPNPTKGLIQIVNQLDIPLEHIELYNSLGQIISIELNTKNNKQVLDLRHLDNGIYMLQFRFKSGASRIEKIILDK